MDQLLDDPLFNVEKNQDFNYYSNRAGILVSRFGQLLSKRETDMLNEPRDEKRSSLERQKSFDDRLKKHYQLRREYTLRFYERFGAVFDPIFRRFCGDSSLDIEDSRRAFSLYVESLANQNKYSELSALRASEIARGKAALDASDDAAFQRADDRSRATNRLLYSVLLRIPLDYNDISANEDKKEEIARFGDELAKALKTDPRLIVLCEEFYVIVGRHVDPDVALEFRKKVLPYFDEEVALKEVEKRHGHSVHDVKFVLLIEPTKFDESVLVVPLDESDEFYESLLKKIHKAESEYRLVVHPRAEAAETFSKIRGAEAKIALFRELTVAKSGKSVFKSPPYNGSLSDENCAILKARLDEESKKPDDEANAAYIGALKKALLARELRDAMRKGDEETLRVGDQIVEASLNGEDIPIIPFGRVIYLTGKRDVAKEFIARAILKYDEKGRKPAALSRFLGALEADNFQEIAKGL